MPHKSCPPRYSGSVIVLVLACFGLSVLVNARSTEASATCGIAGNYFDGSGNNGDTRGGYPAEGIQGNIIAHNTSFCASTVRGSFAANWVMVTDNQLIGHGGYAQAGIDQEPDCALRYFSQFRVSSHFTPKSNFAPCGSLLTGSNHLYSVVYDPAAHHLSMYVNNSFIGATTFDPYAHWANSWGWQIQGETGIQQDLQPGNTASHVNYSNIRWQSAATDGWRTDYPGPLDPRLSGPDETHWGYDPLHVTSCCGKLVGTWEIT